jgi:hypothetical protein
MDGVLLEVLNQKERCCTWSLVATAIHIPATSVSLFQDLSDTSNTMFIPRPLLWPSNVGLSSTLNQVHSLLLVYHQATTLLASCLSSSYVLVVLHVLQVPIPSFLAKLMGVKFDPTLKRVPVQEFLPGDRRHPSTLEIEKGDQLHLCVSSIKEVVPLSLSAYIEQVIQCSQCFPCIPTSEDVWRHSQSHRQKSGSTGVSLP